MIAQRLFKVINWVFISIFAMIISAYGSIAATEGEAKKPDRLNIAFISEIVIDEPWLTGAIQGLERVKKVKPHGLDINWSISEHVWPGDAERVMREYAKTGKYGIIMAYGAYQEAIEKLRREYTDILWFEAGSGANPPFGGNYYWNTIRYHEPLYLIGMIAGMMTKSNVIGAVAAYPYGDINLPLNAYIAGAKAVNPDVKLKVTYIESWFDPPKAKEAALAQIAVGADFIFAERFGPFEACKEKGKLAFGHMVDQYLLGPEVVVTSSLGIPDTIFKYIINEWWNHVTKGVPYNAPEEGMRYGMRDGVTDLAPYHHFESLIPQEVKEKVSQTKQAIKEGKLIVPYNENIVVSE